MYTGLNIIALTMRQTSKETTILTCNTFTYHVYINNQNAKYELRLKYYDKKLNNFLINLI